MKENAKLHLVTDQGFATKFLLSLTLYLCVALAVASNQSASYLLEDVYESARESMLEGAHRMAWWSMLALLSSSCCVIQIIFSLLNLGCAGFNTYLGPMRPPLLALTFMLQGASWYIVYLKPFQIKATAPLSVVSALLAFSPECLALVSYCKSRQWNAGVKQQKLQNAASGAVTSFRFKVNNVGCISCVDTLKSAMRSNTKLPELVGCDVEVGEEGSLTVDIIGDDSNETRVEIEATVADAGFQCEFVGCIELGQKKADSEKEIEAGERQWDISGVVFGAWQSILLGLLSSSCCAFQLILNGLSMLNLAHIGCAGFNKVLGPVRFQLRILTTMWISGMWILGIKQQWPKKRLALSSAICLFLSFLPEILIAAGGPALAPPTAGSHVLKLKIDGMGCEACGFHVKSLLDASSGVLHSSVDYKSGEAEVVVNPEWNFNLTDLAAKLDWDGFFIDIEDYGAVAAASLLETNDPGVGVGAEL